jgi:hypothetical protein
MMGRQTADQWAFFYEFDLDERVPADHLLRRIDVFATAALSDLHKELEAFYSHTGRPSIDPQLLIRMLRTTGTLHSDNTFRYVSIKADCDACPLKSKCCPNQPQRRVGRDPNEAARDYARSLAGTPEFEQSANKRKKVEMRFGHLKTHHGFDRMRLRGLSGASDEFHLAAIAQNLKKMALRLMTLPVQAAACAAM